jgi:ankyrin repeat protein
LEYLISLGIDIHARDGFRRTVLYYAATFNTPSVLQYLISQGADVHAGYGHGGNLLNTCLNYNGFGAGEVKGVAEEKKRILREAM